MLTRTSRRKPQSRRPLSLIDARSPRPKRSGALKTGSAFAPLGSKPPPIRKSAAAKAAEPAKPAEPPKKSLDQEKAEALNLFDEQEKKEQAKKDRRADAESAALRLQALRLRPSTSTSQGGFCRPSHC